MPGRQASAVPTNQRAVIILFGSFEPALDDSQILILRQSLVVIGIGADEIHAADAAV